MPTRLKIGLWIGALLAGALAGWLSGCTLHWGSGNAGIEPAGELDYHYPIPPK